MECDDLQVHNYAEEMGMSIYYVFFLRKGPTRSLDSTPEIDVFQEAHLANYSRLEELGKLAVTVPFLDAFAISGDLRGMGVLKAGSFGEARELISTDPLVKVNRLIFELHPWMIAKNIFP